MKATPASPERSVFLSLATAILVGCLMPAGPLFAQQYSFKVYGLEQGLTNLGIKSLHQDREGFLWVSTENGIFRYDGERFQPFGEKEGIPASSGVAFGEAPDGSLLAGGEFGLFRKTGQRFERVPVPGARTVTWFSGIQPDGKGSTYIATDVGLMQMRLEPGGKGYAFHLWPQPAGVSKPNAYGLFVEEDAVWYGCDEQLCRLKDGQTTVWGRDAGLPPSKWRSIRRAGNGDLWAQGRSQVALLRGGSVRFEIPDGPFQPTGSRGILSVDSSGRVIVGTDDGLAIRDSNAWTTVGRSSGLRGSVYCTLQDREGSLWVGLEGRGLVRWLGYREWEAFTSESGLGSDIAYQMLPLNDGTVWAGTEAGLSHGRKNGAGWTWHREKPFDGISIHAVGHDKAGRLWLGTDGRGAARFDPATGQVEWFTEKQGLNGKYPFSLGLDRQDRIWAATEKGLYVADLKTGPQFHVVEATRGIRVWTVIEATNGEIWAGSDKGIFRLSAGTWSHLTTADGLSHDVVLSLAANSSGDVWIGYRYGGGLDQIRVSSGKPEVVRPVNTAGGKPATVYFLGWDAQSRLWAGTDRGVDIWSGRSWSHYDRRDGLVWDDCDLSGFAAEPDGSVWIGTSGGLAKFMPQAAAPVYAPEVIYTSVVLGGKEIDPGSQASAEHNANTLHTRFSAVTFARESSVIVRYRLSPLFNEWRETRQRELHFDGMPAGKYTLEVFVRDGWGRWSAEPAVFSFQILAPWWRGRWGLPVLLFMPVAVVALVSRLRGAAMRNRERNLLRLVEKRTAELKEANEHLIRLSRLEHEKNLAEEQRAHAEEVAQLNRRAIETLALAIEAKDETTGDHLQRVEVYAIEIAKEMGLDQAGIEALRAAALLHDVGKLAVPDYIISKPGRLTPEEFEKMKAHTVVGAEIVEQIRFPYPVAPAVRSHHEKWDGTGYPDGLSGDRIPIGARILAAVDCLDALACDRQYRRAIPSSEAIAIVQAQAGKSFDPVVVEILARRYVELEQMARNSGSPDRIRLSTNLKIARGESPAAGFQITPPPVQTGGDLMNLHQSLVSARNPEQTLAEMIQTLAELGDPDAVFAFVREHLSKIVPYELMVVYSREEETLVPGRVDGDEYRLFASVGIPMGTGLSGWVAKNHKPIVNGNPAVEPGYLKNPGKFGALQSALAVPLESHGANVGVMSLYRKERDAFTTEDVSRLAVIAAAVAAAERTITRSAGREPAVR